MISQQFTHFPQGKAFRPVAHKSKVKNDSSVSDSSMMSIAKSIANERGENDSLSNEYVYRRMEQKQRILINKSLDNKTAGNRRDNFYKTQMGGAYNAKQLSKMYGIYQDNGEKMFETTRPMNLQKGDIVHNNMMGEIGVLQDNQDRGDTCILVFQDRSFRVQKEAHGFSKVLQDEGIVSEPQSTPHASSSAATGALFKEHIDESQKNNPKSPIDIIATMTKIKKEVDHQDDPHSPKNDMQEEKAKGAVAEKEHMGTFKKLYNHEVTPEEAPKEVTKDHLKENKEYYKQWNPNGKKEFLISQDDEDDDDFEDDDDIEESFEDDELEVADNSKPEYASFSFFDKPTYPKGDNKPVKSGGGNYPSAMPQSSTAIGTPGKTFQNPTQPIMKSPQQNIISPEHKAAALNYMKENKFKSGKFTLEHKDGGKFHGVYREGHAKPFAKLKAKGGDVASKVFGRHEKITSTGTEHKFGDLTVRYVQHGESSKALHEKAQKTSPKLSPVDYYTNVAEKHEKMSEGSVTENTLKAADIAKSTREHVKNYTSKNPTEHGSTASLLPQLTESKSRVTMLFKHPETGVIKRVDTDIEKVAHEYTRSSKQFGVNTPTAILHEVPEKSPEKPRTDYERQISSKESMSKDIKDYDKTAKATGGRQSQMGAFPGMSQAFGRKNQWSTRSENIPVGTEVHKGEGDWRHVKNYSNKPSNKPVVQKGRTNAVFDLKMFPHETNTHEEMTNLVNEYNAQTKNPQEHIHYGSKLGSYISKHQPKKADKNTPTAKDTAGANIDISKSKEKTEKVFGITPADIARG